MASRTIFPAGLVFRKPNLFEKAGIEERITLKVTFWTKSNPYFLRSSDR